MAQKGEKTEEPTPRRQRKAKERGQVARSREVPSALVLGAALVYFYVMGVQFLTTISGNLKTGLSSINLYGTLSPEALQVLLKRVASTFAAAALPLMVLIGFTVILCNIAQGGFVFTGYPLKPKLDRLNPLRGIRRVFGSLRTLAETATSSIKLVMVALIGYMTIKPELSKVPIMYAQSVSGTIVYLANLALTLLVRVFIFLIVLAILDFFYRKFEHKRSLKMTKREVKDEFKETEGDPLIKRRIRQKQYQMARRRMISEVPKADVVITNPTRIAVALSYLEIDVGAPIVVAKGAGAIAERIISVATDNRVPVVENRPLAQVLFNTVDIGELIPESLYKAVAEVLAYVYKLKNTIGRATARRTRPKAHAANDEASRAWA